MNSTLVGLKVKIYKVIELWLRPFSLCSSICPNDHGHGCAEKPNLSHALACAEPIFSYTTVSEKELSNVKSTYTWFYSYAVYLKEIASFATIQYNSMLRRKYLREVLLIDKSSTFGEQSMTKHLLSDK